MPILKCIGLILCLNSLSVAWKIDFSAGRKCEISTRTKFSRNQPFLKVHGSNQELLPGSDGKIILKYGQRLDVCCPDECKIVKCVYKTDFQTLKGLMLDSEQWSCSQSHKPFAYDTKKPCLGKGSWVRSGLKFGNSSNPSIIELLRICFDFESSTTLLVIHNFNRTALRQQPHVQCKGPWFFKGYFRGVGNANARYVKHNAHHALMIQLNDRAIVDKIENVRSKTRFLAKGHLAPKFDFIFAPEKLATCTLLNAVPQFQSINNGNWKEVEHNVHRLIENNPASRLTVYTGTFGVLEVRNKSLYLAPAWDSKHVNRMPIPKCLYKVVEVHPSRTKHVIVSVNNPFSTMAEIENPKYGYVICKDTCTGTGPFPCDIKRYIRGNRARETAYMNRGYIYTCGFENFVSGLHHFYGINLMPIFGKSDGIHLHPLAIPFGSRDEEWNSYHSNFSRIDTNQVDELKVFNKETRIRRQSNFVKLPLTKGTRRNNYKQLDNNFKNKGTTHKTFAIKTTTHNFYDFFPTDAYVDFIDMPVSSIGPNWIGPI